MLKNCDKIMHFRFNFDACLMHSPFVVVHLTHQNLSGHVLFCHNSLPKVNTQLLIYNKLMSILDTQDLQLSPSPTALPLHFFPGQGPSPLKNATS